MRSYDFIGVIYNPISTGNAKRIAEEFATEVYENREHLGVEVTLTPTEYAGHAIELAKQFSLTHTHPLIISASGDGGFNEVINGAMLAKQERPTVSPVVAVLGAGNANDHARVMTGDAELIDLLMHSDPKPLDILRLEADDVIRYAHSYIGFGISSEVGRKLGNDDKGLLGEAGLVVETLQTYEPFAVIQKGRKILYDSIVFANINEMAKVVKLDATNTVTDGKFEVVAHRHDGKLRSLVSLLHLALFGVSKPKSVQSYTFVTTAKSAQLDGEIVGFEADETTVTVTCQKHALESLYI